MIDAITYIISTIFTFTLGKISKKFGWNETVPIPVQNCCIAVLVFLVSALIFRAMGNEATMEDIAQKIFMSFGGAGTATLYYDTTKKGE